MPHPLVSVVIPTHERRDLVLRAVGTALAQAVVDTDGAVRELELLVVDDGSTDGTADAVEALGDERIHVIRRAVAGGPAAARNAGLDVARGEFIAFLDSDDRWVPGSLQRRFDALAGELEAGVAYGPYLLSLNGHVIGHDIPLPTGDVFPVMVAGWTPTLTDSILARRELFDGLRFDPELDGVEDLGMWLELAYRSPWAVTDEPVAIVEKAPAGDRMTMDLPRRLGATERLHAQWADRTAERGLSAAWDSHVLQMNAVARATAGGGSVAERVHAARELVTAHVSPRTKIAGTIRLLLGRTVASWAQRTWFALRARRTEQPS